MLRSLYVPALVPAASNRRRAEYLTVSPKAALRQIVINFIENALKFGPDGQTVTVTVDLERPATPGGTEGLLRLSVDDEGPGVPSADRDRIWQPFVRLAEGGSAPAGTGLGLSVVRQLVAELGGRWSVFNLPERGARFRVELPVESSGEWRVASGECSDSLTTLHSPLSTR